LRPGAAGFVVNQAGKICFNQLAGATNAPARYGPRQFGPAREMIWGGTTDGSTGIKNGPI